MNAVDEKGLDAFTTAKYSRKDDIAALLLERGAKISIFSAAMIGDDARIRELAGQDRSLVSLMSHDGWTALHLAAFFGHLSSAKALIEAGAPVNARGTNQMANMPIHAAVAGRKADLVALLIENAAAVNARQHGGWTALHGAAQNGDLSIANLLIGAGAEIDARADNQQTPLDLAMLKGHQDMVDILEDHAAGSTGIK